MRLEDTTVGPLSPQSESGSLGPMHYATEEQAAKARTLDMIKLLRRDPTVSYAEPNYINHAMAIPNDPYYGRQWHYRQINLPAAWDVTTGDDDVVVAVIDSGVGPHPDLSDRILRHRSGAWVGYDFVDDDSNPTDPGDRKFGNKSSFHGTHVAGTIGAKTDNGKGVAGVTWQGKLMPLRVLGFRGRGSDWNVSQAIRYAARLNNSSGTRPPVRADVMNLSLGPSNRIENTTIKCEIQDFTLGETLRKAIVAAFDAGIVIVASAGNDDCHVPPPMAKVDGVIMVGAVGADARKAPYSNHGRHIDVAAPGGDLDVDKNGDGRTDGVYSTMGDDSGPVVKANYIAYEGTSMAAPHVAGVVALMLSVNPDLTPDDVNMLLADTHPHPDAGPITRDLGAPEHDNIYGHGLINAHKAVQVAQAIARAGGPPPPLDDEPVLSVFPESLNFGTNRTDLELELRNIGTGELRVTDIRTHASWLTVEGSRSSGFLTVRVNRAGLEQKSYLGLVSINSNGGNQTIPVAMQVQSGRAGGAVGTIYVLVLEPDTLQSTGKTQTGAAGRYVYRTPKMPGGSYLVVGGTDRDNDGFICDTGEACGIYPLQDNPSQIKVDGDRRGIDFLVSVNLLATEASSQGVDFDALPPEGFRREEEETEGFRR